MLTATSIRHFLLAGTLLLLAGMQQAQAQAANPATGGPTPQATNATEVPLDGGASLLLAGGVAYGLRKLRQRRK